MSAIKNERYYFLDGLRGWGALAVVLWHVFVQAFPISPEWTDYLRYFFLPANGNFAVELFFVISGFALSIAYLRRHDFKALARIAAGRYLRLAIPILVACALVHFAMASGIVPPLDLRPGSFEDYLRFDPTIHHLFVFSLFDVFFRFSPEQSYILPLWTMSFELIGSVVIIGCLFVLGRFRRTLLIVCTILLCVLLFQNSLYSLFVAGLIIANLCVLRDVSTWPSQTIFWILFLLGWCAPFLEKNELQSPWFMLMAIGFFCATLRLALIRHFFERRISLFLGQISFPLYLVHGAVLWTFSAWCKIFLTPFFTNIAIMNLVVGGATVVLSICGAMVFSPVNNFALQASRIFGTFVVNNVASGLGMLSRKFDSIFSSRNELKQESNGELKNDRSHPLE